jgi:SAM-dependent methyltransferase
VEKYKYETMAAYRKHADKFAEKFGKLTDIARRKEFKTFLDLLQGNKILDIGCGSGDHAVYFKGCGLDVTCIDLSPEMVQICKEKGLNATVMDMENMTFPPESFDGIWAVTSLLHVPKAKFSKVVISIHEMLKSSGVLYVCMKKGGGEGMIADGEGNTNRFFSFWEEQDLINEFKEYFDVIKPASTPLMTPEYLCQNKDYVMIFFRKK